MCLFGNDSCHGVPLSLMINSQPLVYCCPNARYCVVTVINTTAPDYVGCRCMNHPAPTSPPGAYVVPPSGEYNSSGGLDQCFSGMRLAWFGYVAGHDTKGRSSRDEDYEVNRKKPATDWPEGMDKSPCVFTFLSGLKTSLNGKPSLLLCLIFLKKISDHKIYLHWITAHIFVPSSAGDLVFQLFSFCFFFSKLWYLFC